MLNKKSTIQLKEKTNLIFVHRLIKSFADSLLTVFAPLLILKTTGKFETAIIYLIFYDVFCVGLNYFLKKFLQKYGLIAICLHIIPVICLQFLFSIKTITLPIVALIALMAGFAQVLYSVPINLVLTFSDAKANLAKFDIPTNIGKCIFILFSGYVIGQDGKISILILSVIGSLLYICSIIPILFSYNVLKTKYQELHNVKPNIDKKEYRTWNIVNCLFGLFQSVIDICVPLFLFINGIAYTAVTVIVALIEILKIFSNLFAKYLVNLHKEFVGIIISVSFMIVGVIVILTLRDSLVLYICSCVISVSFPLMHVTVSGAYFRKINKDNYQFDGMVNRDICIFFSRCFMYAPALLIGEMAFPFSIGFASAVVLPILTYKLFKK